MKSETALGTAYLYTVITFTFTLLSAIASLTYGGISIDIMFIAEIGLLWLCASAVLIIVLHSQNKKLDRSFGDNLKDPTISKSVGVIILAICILSLPSMIGSVNSSIQVYRHNPAGLNAAGFNIIGVILDILVYILKVGVGIYLFFRKKSDVPGVEKDIFPTEAAGIALLFTTFLCAFEFLSRIISLCFSKSAFRFDFWLIPAVFIVSFLYAFSNEKGMGYNNSFNNKTVSASSGFLLLIDGLLSISRDLPIKINSYNQIQQLQSGGSTNSPRSTLLKTILLLIVPILQMLLGILLIRRTKKTDEYRQ